MFWFIKKKRDPETLSYFKSQYLNEKTTESTEALFTALKHSKVWVPYTTHLLDEGEEQEGARLKPDILQKGEDYFYPCFSIIEEIPENYYARFSWLQLPFTDCLSAAEGIESFPVRGIVLDAFPDSVEIDKEAFVAIR